MSSLTFMNRVINASNPDNFVKKIAEQRDVAARLLSQTIEKRSTDFAAMYYMYLDSPWLDYQIISDIEMCKAVATETKKTKEFIALTQEQIAAALAYSTPSFKLGSKSGSVSLPGFGFGSMTSFMTSALVIIIVVVVVWILVKNLNGGSNENND